MELAPPPQADFEPANPQVDDAPAADYEQARPEIAPPAQADFEAATPEIEQAPPSDVEQASPELYNGDDDVQ